MSRERGKRRGRSRKRSEQDRGEKYREVEGKGKSRGMRMERMNGGRVDSYHRIKDDSMENSINGSRYRHNLR